MQRPAARVNARKILYRRFCRSKDEFAHRHEEDIAAVGIGLRAAGVPPVSIRTIWASAAMQRKPTHVPLLYFTLKRGLNTAAFACRLQVWRSNERHDCSRLPRSNWHVQALLSR